MIFVFKTTVLNNSDIRSLRPFLNELLGNAKWNFDLEDCDKILRIDGLKEVKKTAIKILGNNGFMCEELPD